MNNRGESMSYKVLLISDYSVREAKGESNFRVLENCGCELKVVQDMVGYSFDQVDEYFRRMETSGADSIKENPDVVAAMEDADIVITAFSAIPSNGIRKAKHLKAICVMRSGAENVNLDVANEYGVKVLNAPGRLAVPVSEYTVGLILAEVKNIARTHAHVIVGDYKDREYVNDSYCFNICGKNVGIIGCGAVGSRVARVLKAMDANILVYDPYASAEKMEALGYRLVDLNTLCRESDIITIHFRLTPETKGMIGEEQFKLMKPTCYLINTARADLVDEKAMIDAIVNRKIGGAGLDVFHQEPLPADYPLFNLPNVTLSNHRAGFCSDIFDITSKITIDEIRHYCETGELIHTVN